MEDTVCSNNLKRNLMSDCYTLLTSVIWKIEFGTLDTQNLWNNILGHQESGHLVAKKANRILECIRKNSASRTREAPLLSPSEA